MKAPTLHFTLSIIFTVIGFLSVTLTAQIPDPYLYLSFETEAEDLSENAFTGQVDGAVSFDVEVASLQLAQKRDIS